MNCLAALWSVKGHADYAGMFLKVLGNMPALYYKLNIFAITLILANTIVK